MGLGPPICNKCMVWATLIKNKRWICEFCNATQNELTHLWEMKNTHINETILSENYHFLKFMKDNKPTT